VSLKLRWSDLKKNKRKRRGASEDSKTVSGNASPDERKTSHTRQMQSPVRGGRGIKIVSSQEGHMRRQSLLFTVPPPAEGQDILTIPESEKRGKSKWGPMRKPTPPPQWGGGVGAESGKGSAIKGSSAGRKKKCEPRKT